MNASVVIPVYGPIELLNDCLAALECDECEHDLVLVDNGTGHPFPDYATVIRNEDNLGYAIACNQGAAAATTDVIVQLNVDTEVQPGWLNPLLDELQDPEVAMVGPLLLYPSGGVQCAGIRTWHGIGHAGGENIKELGPTRDVDGVTGACMTVRRDVWDALGGLDEQFKTGKEDVEFCLRVKDAGYRIRFVAESVVTHIESATPARPYEQQNIAYLNAKWGNR